MSTMLPRIAFSNRYTLIEASSIHYYIIVIIISRYIFKIGANLGQNNN